MGAWNLPMLEAVTEVDLDEGTFISFMEEAAWDNISTQMECLFNTPELRNHVVIVGIKNIYMVDTKVW